ncbi:MAG: O-antigen ligase family protein [Bacteroidales bacterium]|nr:O-antigen ligase family protein [Bacteroidales bacterium]
MFLSILFFATIFVLLCLLLKQAHEQHFQVFTLAFLIILLPLRESLNSWGMLIVSVLIVIAFILNKSRQFTWQPIFYAVVGLYLLNFVWLVGMGDFTFSNRGVDSALPMILFPILFSMVQLSKRNVMLLLRFFVWMVIAVCIYGLLSYASAVYELSWKMVLLEGKQYAHFFTIWPITWQPSALSITLLMALPVSFYLRYHNKRQITFLEMLLATILPILVTFMVGARIGVAVFPVLLALGYLFYCNFKPILKWGLVAVGVVGLCLALFFIPTEIKSRYTDQIRVDLRNTAISAIKEKPILGWGTWQQRHLIVDEDRAKSLGIQAPHSQWHFHNLYLDIMVQFGIVGIVVLLGLIFWTFWIAIREKHFLLLSFIIMSTMTFYFEIVLYSSRWAVTFMFWFCFLISYCKYLSGRTS